MLKGTKLKIASNIALTSAMESNTAAINNQARVQQRTNVLYERDLQTRDRVDISREEYEELIRQSKLLDSLKKVVKGICESSKLTVEELAEIDETKIDATYHHDCCNLGLDVIVRLKTDLPLYRQREIMRY